MLSSTATDEVLAQHTWPATHALITSILDLGDESVIQGGIVVELGAGQGVAGKSIAQITNACYLIQTDWQVDAIEGLDVEEGDEDEEDVEKDACEEGDESDEDNRKSEKKSTEKHTEEDPGTFEAEIGDHTKGNETESIETNETNETNEGEENPKYLRHTHGFKTMQVDWFDPLSVESLCSEIIKVRLGVQNKTGTAPGLLLICSDGTFSSDVLEPLMCTVGHILANWHLQNSDGDEETSTSASSPSSSPSQCFIAHVDRDPDFLIKVFKLSKQLHLEILSSTDYHNPSESSKVNENPHHKINDSEEKCSVDEGDTLNFMRSIVIGTDTSSFAPILLWTIRLQPDHSTSEALESE